MSKTPANTSKQVQAVVKAACTALPRAAIIAELNTASELKIEAKNANDAAATSALTVVTAVDKWAEENITKGASRDAVLDAFQAEFALLATEAAAAGHVALAELATPKDDSKPQYGKMTQYGRGVKQTCKGFITYDLHVDMLATGCYVEIMGDDVTETDISYGKCRKLVKLSKEAADRDALTDDQRARLAAIEAATEHAKLAIATAAETGELCDAESIRDAMADALEAIVAKIASDTAAADALEAKAAAA